MSPAGNPVAVITGAAGAVGAALAGSFAADGYTVHGVDLDPNLDAVMSPVGGVPHRADVTDEDQLGALAALPSVDVLINAVGAWPLLSLAMTAGWRSGSEATSVKKRSRRVRASKKPIRLHVSRNRPTYR